MPHISAPGPRGHLRDAVPVPRRGTRYVAKRQAAAVTATRSCHGAAGAAVAGRVEARRQVEVAAVERDAARPGRPSTGSAPAGGRRRERQARNGAPRAAAAARAARSRVPAPRFQKSSNVWRPRAREPVLDAVAQPRALLDAPLVVDGVGQTPVAVVAPRHREAVGPHRARRPAGRRRASPTGRAPRIRPGPGRPRGRCCARTCP